jgi:ABC-2 type transport system permease protein
MAAYLLSSAAVPVIFGTLEMSGYSSEARWAWLANPFWLVDAVQSWLFGTPSHAEGPYPGGPVPALLVAALIAAALAVLALRYRKAASR